MMFLFLLLAACDDPETSATAASTDTAAAWDAGYEKGWEEAQATIDALQDALDSLDARVALIEEEDDDDAGLSGWARIKSDGSVDYDGSIDDGDTWLSSTKTATGRYTVTLNWDVRTSPLCVATIHQEGAYDTGASVYASGGTIYVSTGASDGTAEDKSFVLACFAEAE